MKKLALLPLAVLAFMAACDDSSNGLLAPEAPVGGPLFHAVNNSAESKLDALHVAKDATVATTVNVSWEYSGESTQNIPTKVDVLLIKSGEELCEQGEGTTTRTCGIYQQVVVPQATAVPNTGSVSFTNVPAGSYKARVRWYALTDPTTGHWHGWGTYSGSALEVSTSSGGSTGGSTGPTDTTAPVVTYTLNPAEPNLSGWYRGNVELTWAISDAESTATVESGCVNQTIATDGQATYSCSVKSAGGTTNVTTVAVKRDATAPGVAYTGAMTAPNANGWYNDNVTAIFTARDLLSGFTVNGSASTSMTGTSTTSSEGASVGVQSPAFTDLAGNTVAAAAVTSAAYKIDKTAPTVVTTASSAPNANNWYNTNVTITFTATEGLSGFGSSDDNKTASEQQTASSEGENVITSTAFTDRAGNSAAARIARIYIDKVAPSISGTASTTSWTNRDVTVSFTCEDATSGIASCETPKTVTSEGANGSASGTATDRAGNSARTTVSGIKIDKTAPEVVYTGASGTEGSNGWYTSNVTATFTATDLLSGFGSSGSLTTTGTSTTQSEGPSVGVQSPVFTDNAGNSAAAVTSAAYKIDKTAPIVACRAAQFALNESPANVMADVSDGVLGSGAVSATVSGAASTSTITGSTPRTVSLTGSDNAGHSTQKSCAYTVTYGSVSAFLEPIPADANYLSRAFKAGSTIPVKFQVRDANGAIVSTAKATIAFTKVSGDTGGDTAEAFTAQADAGNSFRYSTDGQLYIFNLGTSKSSVGTFRITATLDDGTTISQRVVLK